MFLSEEEPLALLAGPAGFKVVNPATDQAVVYQGVAATLNVTLTNHTGADIPLNSSGAVATLEIFMPDFFASGDLKNMKIELSGWTFPQEPAEHLLILTYSGPQGRIWKAAEALFFSITGVTSSSQPGSDALQVNPVNLGRMPLQLEAPLSLALPPKPGNAKLSDVLQVSLDTQGAVLVSTPDDPLSNSLFLNLKNIGEKPLYSGQALRASRPRVIVTFVYGSTAGCLAPDNDKIQPAVSSAWNIQAAIRDSEGNAWHPTNPNLKGDAAHPSWILEPINTNQGVIGGGGAGANITFAFSKIVSFTPPGHTEMVVQFTGFSKDETTLYDDAVFILDISKQVPPATRGLLHFYSPKPVVTVSEPEEVVRLSFSWVMFHVGSVKLVVENDEAHPIHQKPYPNPPALDYDYTTVEIPYAKLLADWKLKRGGKLTFTLQAFAGGSGAPLPSQQFTLWVTGLWRTLSFSSTVSSLTVDDPARVLEIPFSWTMFKVAKIDLRCSKHTVPQYPKDYPRPKLKDDDRTTIRIPSSVLADEPTDPDYRHTLNFFLDSFDDDEDLLNSRSHTVSVYQRFFVDPRDNQKYPVVEMPNARTGRKVLWMAQNLDYNTGDDRSYFYGNDPQHEAQYGRLYTIEGAKHNLPSPWRIPTQSDWTDLLQTFKTPEQAYKALIGGGSSGLNIQLGGFKVAGFTGLGTQGYYWSGTEPHWVFFGNAKVTYLKIRLPTGASVRYIRDL